MPKFRKKPIEIEATQWSEKDPFAHPGVKRERGPGPYVGRFFVITIHDQPAFLMDGDWILPEPKPDRYYPCKPDIFAATYDAVE